MPQKLKLTYPCVFASFVLALCLYSSPLFLLIPSLHRLICCPQIDASYRLLPIDVLPSYYLILPIDILPIDRYFLILRYLHRLALACPRPLHLHLPLTPWLCAAACSLVPEPFPCPCPCPCPPFFGWELQLGGGGHKLLWSFKVCIPCQHCFPTLPAAVSAASSMLGSSLHFHGAIHVGKGSLPLVSSMGLQCRARWIGQYKTLPFARP
eukprot:1154673-Pelagomonas_calceolata.AAC.2